MTKCRWKAQVISKVLEHLFQFVRIWTTLSCRCVRIITYWCSRTWKIVDSLVCMIMLVYNVVASPCQALHYVCNCTFRSTYPRENLPKQTKYVCPGVQQQQEYQCTTFFYTCKLSSQKQWMDAYTDAKPQQFLLEGPYCYLTSSFFNVVYCAGLVVFVLFNLRFYVASGIDMVSVRRPIHWI